MIHSNRKSPTPSKNRDRFCQKKAVGRPGIRTRPTWTDICCSTACATTAAGPNGEIHNCNVRPLVRLQSGSAQRLIVERKPTNDRFTHRQSELDQISKLEMEIEKFKEWCKKGKKDHFDLISLHFCSSWKIKFNPEAEAALSFYCQIKLYFWRSNGPLLLL